MMGHDSAVDMEVAMALEGGSVVPKSRHLAAMQHRGGQRMHGQLAGRHPLPHHSYYNVGQGMRSGMVGRGMGGRLRESEMAMYDDEEEGSRESYGSDDMAGHQGY